MKPTHLLFLLAAIVSLHLSMVDSVFAVVTIDWVDIGDPGNVEHTEVHIDGTIGYGAVDYSFRIGEYEVTNAQYVELLNAVAATDSNSLYSSVMGTSVYGGISRSGSSGSYTYSLRPHMADKPVAYVSWFDGARLANWLHNGQPTGPQNSSTTEDGAYTFINTETVGPRNVGALIHLPNEHEWQKAAFYEPGAETGDGDEYWDHATGADFIDEIGVLSDPNGVALDPGPFKVNRRMNANWNGAPQTGNVISVGSAGNQSYYGAKDMVGNVFEWLEADPNKPDPFEHGPHIVRGGSFFNSGHVWNTERNNGPKIGDGDSDGIDFLIWQRQFGGLPGLESGDFVETGFVDGNDLARWETSYGINDDADGDSLPGHIHNIANKTTGLRLAAPELILPILDGGNDSFIQQQQPGGSALLAATFAVPEPTALAMVVVALSVVAHGRSRTLRARRRECLDHFQSQPKKFRSDF